MPDSGQPFVLAFGDSLTAGYGLKREEALPARLQALLREVAPRAVVQNAGVSGDTSGGALARLPRLLSSLTRRPDLAIVEFGAATRKGAWAARSTLTEMGMVVISSTLTVGGISHAFNQIGEPTGEGGLSLTHAFPRFADNLAWWTEAAREQRARRPTLLTPRTHFRPFKAVEQLLRTGLSSILIGGSDEGRSIVCGDARL